MDDENKKTTVDQLRVDESEKKLSLWDFPFVSPTLQYKLRKTNGPLRPNNAGIRCFLPEFTKWRGCIGCGLSWCWFPSWQVGQITGGGYRQQALDMGLAPSLTHARLGDKGIGWMGAQPPSGLIAGYGSGPKR